MAGLETVDEMFDLRMSEEAKPLFEKVKAFIKDEVKPITAEFFRLGENREERWSWAPGQLELLDGVKAKAKAPWAVVIDMGPYPSWPGLWPHPPCDLLSSFGGFLFFEDSAICERSRYWL